jgi:hypothetical protein
MIVKHTLIVGAFCVLFFSTASTVSSSDLRKLQTEGDAFKSGVLRSLPLNAGLGLSWSDVYIGQLVSVQPHFGFGVSAGLSSVSTSDFKNILESFGTDCSGAKNILLPVLLAETRLGGFVLPFDIGLKFGTLHDLSSSRLFLSRTKIDFMLAGGDLRARIYRGGVIAPAISIGLGYNYLTGALHTPLPDSDFSIGSNVLSATAPEAELFWEMSAIDLKVQLAKRFGIITPYLAAAGTFYWASAGYKLKGGLKYSGSWDALNADLTNAGINGIAVNQNGFSSESEASTGIATRLLGGFSLNLFIFRLDCSAIYSFADLNWGSNVGLRLQV